MEKPKCRLCGVRHLSGEPHQWPGVGPAEIGAADKGARMATTRNREAYRAYMREYMRKRRAAAARG